MRTEREEALGCFCQRVVAQVEEREHWHFKKDLGRQALDGIVAEPKRR